MNTQEEIMSPKQAAKYVGVSLATFYKLIKNGEIPAKKIGNQWRIARSVLDEMIRKGDNGK